MGLIVAMEVLQGLQEDFLLVAIPHVFTHTSNLIQLRYSYLHSNNSSNNNNMRMHLPMVQEW
jgi:hypothetical protein